MNNTVAIGVRFILGESSTGEDRESNTKCLEIEYSLLQSTVPSTAKIPSTPMARLLLGKFPVECPLDKSLLPDCLSLLSERRRDVH